METAHIDNFEKFDYEDEERNRVLPGEGYVFQEGIFFFKIEDNSSYDVQ